MKDDILAVLADNRERTLDDVLVAVRAKGRRAASASVASALDALVCSRYVSMVEVHGVPVFRATKLGICHARA